MIYTVKSQNIPPTCIFWLKGLSILSVSLKAAFSVELPCLEQNCSGTNTLSVCKQFTVFTKWRKKFQH